MVPYTQGSSRSMRCYVPRHKFCGNWFKTNAPSFPYNYLELTVTGFSIDSFLKFSVIALIKVTEISLIQDCLLPNSVGVSRWAENQDDYNYTQNNIFRIKVTLLTMQTFLNSHGFVMR